MKTQELKQYIDRVLGNSIRCLLPSYWWKRVFGAVIDNTISKDEVKTINGESILGEGDLRVGVKSVESVEALEKLDARVGEIASALGRTEPATVKFADCYVSVDYENDWDKYTIIRGVEETSQMPPESGGAVYLTASKDSLNKDCVIVGYEESRRAYMKYTNAKDEIISLQQVNELLASGKYRAAIGFSASGIDQYFTFYTKVAEYTADAYIKGDTWTRLLKEGDVTGGGAEALSIYFPFGEGTQLSAEQKNSNADTYSALQSSNKKSIHFYVVAGDKGTVWFPVCHYYQSKPQGGEAYFNIITYDWDDNSPFQKLHFKLYSDGRIEAVEYIKADSELSETSENPVQNKVVTEALGILEEHLAVHSKQISSLGLSMATKEELNNKADKSDIKTINGVSLLGGGNLQLGDGQTIVYDDSAVYDRIAEVEELAAQAKVSSELAIEELNIHLEEVNEGLLEQVSSLMKKMDELAEELRALTSRVEALENK